MRKGIHFAAIILTVGLVFGLVSDAPGGVRDQFNQAEIYQKDKQYDYAEQIYRQIIAQFPDSNDALEAQKQLTCLYLATKRQAQAAAAFEELTTAFSGHKDIAQAVHDIAYQYRRINRQENANELDQYVIGAWPQSDYALLGQMDIAKYYVDQGNEANAQAAIDKLLADFSDNPLTARAVHDVAQHYRWSGKYEKANRLYQHVVTNWPNAEHALWAQADLIKSYLALGDDPNAEAAVEKLLANFTANPLAARAVWDTGQHYRELKKYEKANELYQHVVKTWPKAEHALWAQADLIKSYLALGDDTSANTAVDRLLTNFNDNPLIARAVWDTGQYYRELKKYEMANKLYQHVVKTSPESEQALWAQADLIKSYLALGDDPNAQAAVDKLLLDFAANPLIARAIHDTAYEYRKLGNHVRANELDQYIIDRWPGDEQAMWAKMDMAKTDILLGNDAAVEKTIDILITDFNDHPGLPAAVFRVGEEYYNKAFQYENQDQGEQAKASFRKAIVISERIIAELPESSFTPQAYILLGECLRRLDQHQDALECYQKVVSDWPDCDYAWYAYLLIGSIYEQLRDSGDIEGPLAYTQIKAAYERILQDYPDCPAVRAASNWLNYYVKTSQGGQK
jgi:tetratricopeptide (TPR) repeat protein